MWILSRALAAWSDTTEAPSARRQTPLTVSQRTPQIMGEKRIWDKNDDKQAKMTLKPVFEAAFSLAAMMKNISAM